MQRGITMPQYEKQILHALLDSYENSRAFQGQGKISRTPQFVFSRKTMPVYFDESSMEYEAIHEAVRQLEEQGYIKGVWKSASILKKVVLNLEAVEDAYAYLGRRPKRNLVDETMQFFRECERHFNTPVCRRLLQYLANRLAEGLSVKEYFDLEDRDSFACLIQAVCAIEQNSSPCYVREFSIRLFHDSKTFERIKGKVLKVFHNFDAECAEKDEKEILAEHGIYHTPDYVYLKGNAKIRTKGGELFLGVLEQGIGISGDDLVQLEIQPEPAIKYVLTIENLTTFFRWQKEGALLIYLGGYHNTVRRRLLADLYRAFPNAQYYHFGDIDAGGFEIYRDLKQKTGIPFQPYKMNLQVLQQHRAYGKELTENDRRHLCKLYETMADDPFYHQFSELIRYMLDENVKLEQECIMPG